jgi:hypothetical protein
MVFGSMVPALGFDVWEALGAHAIAASRQRITTPVIDRD